MNKILVRILLLCTISGFNPVKSAESIVEELDRERKEQDIRDRTSDFIKLLDRESFDRALELFSTYNTIMPDPNGTDRRGNSALSVAITKYAHSENWPSRKKKQATELISRMKIWGGKLNDRDLRQLTPETRGVAQEFGILKKPVEEPTEQEPALERTTPEAEIKEDQPKEPLSPRLAELLSKLERDHIPDILVFSGNGDSWVKLERAAHIKLLKETVKKINQLEDESLTLGEIINKYNLSVNPSELTEDQLATKGEDEEDQPEAPLDKLRYDLSEDVHDLISLRNDTTPGAHKLRTEQMKRLRETVKKINQLEDESLNLREIIKKYNLEFDLSKLTRDQLDIK